MTTYTFAGLASSTGLAVTPGATATTDTGMLTPVISGVQFTFSIQLNAGSGVNAPLTTTASAFMSFRTSDLAVSFTSNSGSTTIAGTVLVNATSPGMTQFLSPVVSVGSVFSSVRITFLGAGTSGQAITAPGPYSASGQVTGIRFTTTGPAAFRLGSITTTVNCLMPGTLLDTGRGEVAVEALRKGDRIRTVDGTRAKVEWIAAQHIDTALTHPARVAPVRIMAGAFGRGLPRRDLCLSPDHALLINGMLVTAGALINGTTVTQDRVMPRGGFTYYHVETGAHQLMMAEGVPVETFIDYAQRAGFDTAATAPGTVIAELALPRVSSARTLPRATRAALDRIARTLLPGETVAAE